MIARALLAADVDASPFGAQIGAVVAMVGGFLAILGLLSWVILRISGAPDTGNTTRELLRGNPFAAALSFLARLLRPGVILLSLGVCLVVVALAVDEVL